MKADPLAANAAICPSGCSKAGVRGESSGGHPPDRVSGTKLRREWGKMSEVTAGADVIPCPGLVVHEESWDQGSEAGKMTGQERGSN